MKKIIFKLIKYTLVLFVFLLAGVALRQLNAPDLQVWHTFVPTEMTVEEMDEADWDGYLAHENKIFDDVYQKVVLKIPASEKNPINRYFEGSRIYPPNFDDNWNRSYSLIPANPKGAVVLLHGLTDAPYSLRHVAQLYYQKDFIVLGIRAPGHGTVPAALTEIAWQEWMAATRLAVREAKKISPENTPLHIVGFSKGATLALKYALDAVEDESLIRPDKLILVSPMIGIMRLSKLAEIIALPALLPGFEKAAWLGIIPEFNPFKYNSFPVNAVKQARLLITDMRRQIIRLHRTGEIKDLPPIISFQSIVDYTVSTPALINDLYSYLPNNNSELVIFDINRGTTFIPLVRPVFVNMASNMLPDLPQRYKMTIIGNTATGDSWAVERSSLPGGRTFATKELGLKYPPDVFSLSHVSLPFPENDPLYGSAPDPETKDEFGLNLGLISNAQGERGVLQINTNLFFRISSNPLFLYLMQRIDDTIDAVPTPPVHFAGEDKIKTKAKMTEEQYNALLKAVEYDEGAF